MSVRRAVEQGAPADERHDESGDQVDEGAENRRSGRRDGRHADVARHRPHGPDLPDLSGEITPQIGDAPDARRRPEGEAGVPATQHAAPGLHEHSVRGQKHRAREREQRPVGIEHERLRAQSAQVAQQHAAHEHDHHDGERPARRADECSTGSCGQARRGRCPGSGGPPRPDRTATKRARVQRCPAKRRDRGARGHRRLPPRARPDRAAPPACR